MRRPANIPGDYPMDAVAIAQLTEQILGLSHRIDYEHDLSKANFVTFEALVKAESEKVKVALDASNMAVAKQELVTDRALTKQETATEKRFESVNEFRGQLNDQIATFMPRKEHAVEITAIREAMARLEDQVKAVQIWQGNITGRLTVGGLIFTVLMAVIIFAANYITRS